MGLFVCFFLLLFLCLFFLKLCSGTLHNLCTVLQESLCQSETELMEKYLFLSVKNFVSEEKEKNELFFLLTAPPSN